MAGKTIVTMVKRLRGKDKGKWIKQYFPNLAKFNAAVAKNPSRIKQLKSGKKELIQKTFKGEPIYTSYMVGGISLGNKPVFLKAVKEGKQFGDLKRMNKAAKDAKWHLGQIEKNIKGMNSDKKFMQNQLGHFKDKWGPSRINKQKALIEKQEIKIKRLSDRAKETKQQIKEIDTLVKPRSLSKIKDERNTALKQFKELQIEARAGKRGSRKKMIEKHNKWSDAQGELELAKKGIPIL